MFRINDFKAPVAVALLSCFNFAQAETATLSLTRLSGSVAQGTAIFRADLSSLTFGQIQSITLIDSDSKTGGSSGQYSGFDLDAIKLSSTFATTAALANTAPSLSVFDFTPAGTDFTPGTQRPPAAAKLNGTDATGLNVDPSFATLSVFDAIFFGTGSVTLGDGGSISFSLTAPVETAGLYLYLGEVSGSAGEGLAGKLVVTSVPEPTTIALLLGGLALLQTKRRYGVSKTAA